MRLIDFLDPAAVIPDLKGREKKDVLDEFAAAMSPGLGLPAERVGRVLADREKLGSTGIGDGIAIPHGKIEGIEGLRVGFARSAAGVDFEAMDGGSTHLFFVLIAPEESVGDHLKMLARISRMLKDTAFRSRLMKANSREDILSLIEEEDAKQ
jgi:PTS system nitrogen regulatory IIA component